MQRLVVNAHHLAEQVEGFAAGHQGPPQVHVVSEPELLGTAGGVRNALDRLGSEPFVVLYGDVLTDAPLAPLLDEHRATGARATVTVYESERTAGKGTVDVAPDGGVLAFREKQPVATATALINAGIYILDPAFMVDFVEPGAVSDFGHDVFPAALAAGEHLHAHRLPRAVLDVGTPEDLERARSL